MGWLLNSPFSIDDIRAAARCRRSRYHWECGVSIRYWQKRLGGRVPAIEEADIAHGHFTRINNPAYKAGLHGDWRRDLSRDLAANFDLDEACRRLGIRLDKAGNTLP